MPRTTGKEYELGEFWLTRREDSATRSYYICWTETGGTVVYRSTRTHDEDKARLKLYEWYHASRGAVQENAPENVPLVTVLETYWYQHGRHCRAPASIRRSLWYWGFFYGDVTVSVIEDKKLRDAFTKWMLKTAENQNTGAIGLSAAYARTVLAHGRAALNFAVEGGQLSRAPRIKLPPEEETVVYRTNVKQLAAMLNACTTERLRRYILLRIATLARHDAIVDLQSGYQLNFEDNLIYLNPEGRTQTKKRRPIIPMVSSVRPLLLAWTKETEKPTHIVNLGGRQVMSVRKVWSTAKLAAGLPKPFIPKCIRHTMSIEMRKRGVSDWDLQGFMGHRKVRTTERYAHYAPDYLSTAAKVVDEIFLEVDSELQILQKNKGKTVSKLVFTGQALDKQEETENRASL